MRWKHHKEMSPNRKWRLFRRFALFPTQTRARMVWLSWVWITQEHTWTWGWSNAPYLPFETYAEAKEYFDGMTR